MKNYENYLIGGLLVAAAAIATYFYAVFLVIKGIV